MAEQTWPGDWLRGPLQLAVMRVLLDGPTYGYAIATRLEQAGFGTVKGGTLYPLLGRLETAGLVETRWEQGEGGPGRKYFDLTPEGRVEFAETSAQWHAFARLTTTFLGEDDT